MDFVSPISWTVFEADLTVLDIKRSYLYGSFDGRYIYWAPYGGAFGGTAEDKNVLRYDTKGDFNAHSSWTIFEAGANQIGKHLALYAGTVFDCQHVYFQPSWLVHPHTWSHEVFRYNTKSWFVVSLTIK